MSKYKYFAVADFDCQETGENKIEDEFVRKLDSLRDVCGWPFIVTSGFRDASHSVEIIKPNGGGYHTKGIASDIKVLGGKMRYEIVSNAIKHGFTGIGIAKTFVHLDIREDTPMIWTY
tara:strand:+ start:1119 stop:1472 length:354 start_codon:yes stop_codon:yes gene_type:complete